MTGIVSGERRGTTEDSSKFVEPVFYFYWFNGRRLLDGPLEALLADPTLDFPFCLMWANENWTRRWDGSDHKVLIAQDRDGPDDAAFTACLARHFEDPRYVRVDGRPLFMVYRPALVSDIQGRVPRWRAMLEARGVGSPIFTMAQSFEGRDPREVGFDGAIEFPPHKICNHLPPLNGSLDILDTDFAARVYSYEDTAAASLAEPAPPFPLIKTVVPSWDNDARRQGGGLVLHGATPALYETWLRDLIVRARETHVLSAIRSSASIAWNEWAEGATLEPDIHYGSAFLNATGRAVTGAARGRRVLLVGHDALTHGAQMPAAGGGATAGRARMGCGWRSCWARRGRWRRSSSAVAPTRVVAFDDPGLPAVLLAYRRAGVDTALVNSCAAGGVAAALAGLDIRVVLLAHEMDGILREKNLVAAAAAGLRAAASVVVAAPEVAEGSGAGDGVRCRRARRCCRRGSTARVSWQAIGRRRALRSGWQWARRWCWGSATRICARGSTCSWRWRGCRGRGERLAVRVGGRDGPRYRAASRAGDRGGGSGRGVRAGRVRGRSGAAVRGG